MSFPILSSLILLPSIGACFLFFSNDKKHKKNNTIKYVALFTSFVNFLISIYLWYLFDPFNSQVFNLLRKKNGLKVLLIIKLVLMGYQYYLLF